MTFGPWEPGLDPAERLARTRALRAFAFAWAHHCSDLIAELKAAETDERALLRALELFDAVPSRPRRKLLALYGQLMRPERPAKGSRENKVGG